MIRFACNDSGWPKWRSLNVTVELFTVSCTVNGGLPGGIRVGIRVARLVLPGLEMHRLGWADAEQDSQNVRMGDPLSQLRIDAGAALLNKGKVEPCGEGDR